MNKLLAFLAVATASFSIFVTADPSEKKKPCDMPCQNTLELMLVCGSDGTTYANPGAVECERLCYPDLKQVHAGPCKENGMTLPPPPSMSTYPSGKKEPCRIFCPNTREFDPVCGSDGITYENPGAVRCEKLCYPDLTQVHKGPCRENATLLPPPPSTNTDPSEKKKHCWIPCLVTRDIDPVCGSDGITYDNPSAMRCEKLCYPDLSQMHGGPCRKNATTLPSLPSKSINSFEKKKPCRILCPNTLEYKPVCGSDGITYPNPGAMKCEKFCYPDLTQVHAGPCREDATTSTPPPPTSTSPPGKEEPCRIPCPSTDEYEPVCGSDGITYPNYAAVRCEKLCYPDLTQVHKGPCRENATTLPSLPSKSINSFEKKKPCRILCPNTLEYKPVCGSDGITYPNPGAMKCEKFCYPDLTQVHAGPCREDATTSTPPPPTSTSPPGKEEPCRIPCPSTDEYEPVCGSDGITYPNYAAVRCEKLCYPDLTQVHKGPCRENATTLSPPPLTRTYPCGKKEPCRIPCLNTREWDPVCGSDGITYDNPSCMRCEKLCYPDLSQMHKGPCRENATTLLPAPSRSTNSSEKKQPCRIPCPNTFEYNPVCGSDGITYDNPSAMRCEKLCYPDLTRVHEGPCRENATTLSPPPSTRTYPCGKKDPCHIPCPNTREWDPVCGSDGITYDNPSCMICEKLCYPDLSQMHKGPCRENATTLPPAPSRSTNSSEKKQPCRIPCPNTFEYNPVCGSDGITYDNPSAMRCEKLCYPDLSQMHEGPCRKNATTLPPPPSMSTYPFGKKEPCHIFCPNTREFDPVCGSDGITYVNPGAVRCEKLCYPDLTQVHEGPCREKATPLTPPPSTRTNPSEKKEPCRIFCPNTKEWDPVCGSDGITYVNPGAVRCEKLCYPDLTQVHAGPCQENETTSAPVSPSTNLSEKKEDCQSLCIITTELVPVCGSDGVTYGSVSALNCAKRCNPDITEVHSGPCQGNATTSSSVFVNATLSGKEDLMCLIPCVDTLGWTPVCGSDGITYPNDVFLLCFKRFCKPDLEQVSVGPCPVKN